MVVFITVQKSVRNATVVYIIQKFKHFVNLALNRNIDAPKMIFVGFNPLNECSVSINFKRHILAWKHITGHMDHSLYCLNRH